MPTGTHGETTISNLKESALPPTAPSAASGDKLAELEQIYRAKAEQVFRLALRLAGNQADAEDVTQQVFLRLLSIMDSKTPIERLDPFLAKLAICATRDLQRSVYSRRRREESRLPSRTTERDSTVNTEPGVLQDVETHQAVQTALQELPEKFREPLVLHFMEEHSKQEVASLLSLPLSTVCLRLETGLKRLRARLQHAQVPVAAVAPAVLLSRAGQVMSCKADLARIWKAIQEAPVTQGAKPGRLFEMKAAWVVGLILLLGIAWIAFAPADGKTDLSETSSGSAGNQGDRTTLNIPTGKQKEIEPKKIELDFSGEAMAFGKGYFWISAAEKPQLVQIDPQTGTRMAVLDLGHFIARRIGGIAWSAEGTLWINDMETGRLFRVHPESRKVEMEYTLGFNPAGMTWHAGNLYTIDSTRRQKAHICRIDPATGKVTQRIPIGTPLDVVVSTFSLEYMADGFLLGTSGSGTPYLYKLSIDSGRLISGARMKTKVRIQSLAVDEQSRLWMLTRGEISTLIPIKIPAEMNSYQHDKPRSEAE